MPDTIIIGAGLTGLSTAYHLKRSSLVLEKSLSAGGLCSSVSIEGYTFDHAGHFIHLHQPQTMRLLTRLLPGKLRKITRKSAIFTHNTWVPYPFQANLYCLPEKIRRECLRGFLSRRSLGAAGSARDFLNWSNSVFGAGITKYFMKPYNEKLWTVSGKVLMDDWVSPFVPRPLEKEVIAGANGAQTKDFGYNVSFYYPERGGIQSVINAFDPEVKNIRLGTACESISLKNRCLITSKGEKLYFSHLVSTQPLVELLKSIAGLPADVKNAASKLRWNTVECLNLGFRGGFSSSKTANGNHWVYFPERKYEFYRAGIYSNVTPSMCPKGRFSMYVEISRDPAKRFDLRSSLLKTIEGLKDCGILSNSGKPEVIYPLSMPYAYVIFDKHRTAALQVIRKYLADNNIFSIGRYGAWEYSFMESSIIAGRETALRISGL